MKYTGITESGILWSPLNPYHKLLHLLLFLTQLITSPLVFIITYHTLSTLIATFDGQ